MLIYIGDAAHHSCFRDAVLRRRGFRSANDHQRGSEKIFGGSVYRAFYSPALPPVGTHKTTFVIYEPVTGQSPVYVSPVPKAEAPHGKADAPAAKATPKKSDEQEPAKR